MIGLIQDDDYFPNDFKRTGFLIFFPFSKEINKVPELLFGAAEVQAPEIAVKFMHENAIINLLFYSKQWPFIVKQLQAAWFATKILLFSCALNHYSPTRFW